MGELVLAYDVQANNKTSKPRAFYALCIRPNDRNTGNLVFKLSTKKMIITPRCKPIPMPDNVVKAVNQMGKDEGMIDRIVFVTYLRNLILMICMKMWIHNITVVVL